VFIRRALRQRLPSNEPTTIAIKSTIQQPLPQSLSDQIFNQPWRDLWPALQAQGWTWDYGNGLHPTYFLLPNTKKSSGTLGVDMFVGEEQVRDYLGRKNRVTRPSVTVKGEGLVANHSINQSSGVSTAPRLKRMRNEENGDDDEELSPFEILKKRRSSSKGKSMGTSSKVSIEDRIQVSQMLIL
jgi:hypothetical protein